MITEIAKYLLRFIVLVLLQVLIFQNIHLGSYIILFPYVLFILTLPFEIPKQLLLVVCFVTGLSIDVFYDTAGMHAAACTFMGLARYYVLRLIAPRDGYNPDMQPNVKYMGNAWFISYAAILVLVHHLFFFYLEMFRFGEFFSTLLRVILSSMGTFLVVYLIQFLFYRTDLLKK